MIKNLFMLWSFFSTSKKKQFSFLLFFILLGSFLEFASLGLIIPLVSIVANPDGIKSIFNPYDLFSKFSEKNLIFTFIFLFILLSILSGFIRTKLITKIANLSYSIGADLNKNIYSFIMLQEYSRHIGINRNNIINILTSRTKMVVTSVIYPILSLFTSIILSIVIISLLLFVDYKLTLAVSIFIIIIYLFIVKITRNNLSRFGETISKNSSLCIQFIRESLSNIKDIKLDNMENFYIEQYSEIDKEVHSSESKILIIGLTPKYILESLLMIVFAFSILYFFYSGQNFSELVPIFALLGLSAQRLLPLFQQIFYCFSSLKGANASLEIILDTINTYKENRIKKNVKKKIKFEHSIVLKNICYKYPDQKNFILNNINLTIKKGESIGIIGKTGSGKSTLLDIIMGLISPSSGDIIIDGKKVLKRSIHTWQQHISYVPQSIFLFNKTIKDNIVIYDKFFNLAYYSKILSIVKLDNFNSGLLDSQKLDGRKIGEMGEKISGGQRQKIAIARALYKNSDLMILDEATSALDNNTEKNIIEAINTDFSNKTVVMVAHRISSLSKCSNVYEIKNGKLLKHNIKHLLKNN
jgi:ABC-type multidrug transport system fused ATPase/permease subunit